METIEKLNLLIEKAIPIAGSQRKLAVLLGLEHANLVQMKQGKRPANWKVRGKLRAITGEDPAHAFMAAMTEDLEQSENEDEKKAADGLKAMLAAFPTDAGWRKRFLTPLRTIVRLCFFVNESLHDGHRDTKALTYTLQRI